MKKTTLHSWAICRFYKRAAKAILDLPGYASSTDALKSLGWPTFVPTSPLNRYVITFKYIHRIVDCDFNIVRNSDIHRYNTRRKNDFRLPLVRTNYGKKRLLYQGIKEWNLLEQSFKDIDSFLIFKQRMFLASFQFLFLIFISNCCLCIFYF